MTTNIKQHGEQQETTRHLSGSTFREETCARCGGFMVAEYFFDLIGTSPTGFIANRCVQCGDVIDPFILKNRAQLSQVGLAENECAAGLHVHS